jgi:hypothetical protein
MGEQAPKSVILLQNLDQSIQVMFIGKDLKWIGYVKTLCSIGRDIELQISGIYCVMVKFNTNMQSYLILVNKDTLLWCLLIK